MIYLIERTRLEEKTEDLILHAIYNNAKFKLITQKFLEIYKIKYEFSKEETIMSWDKFLGDIINNNLELFQTTAGVRKLRKNHTETARDLKLRWIESTKRSLNKKTTTLLKKELKDIKKAYITTGELPYGLKKAEDIIDIRLNFLKDWASSVRNPVIEFPYLLDLTDSKIASALKHDIILNQHGKLHFLIYYSSSPQRNRQTHGQSKL